MGWLSNRYSRPGPGIEKNAPKKTGAALFFDILWRELFELLKLNLLFIVTSLPIVTIPASITAMSRVITRMVRDEPYFLWSDYWKSFRGEFKRATIVGLCTGAGMAVALFSIRFYAASVGQNAFFYLPLGMAGCLLVMLIFFSFYVFPMLALIDLPLRVLAKNAALLACVCARHNLLALVFVGLLVLAYVLLLPFSFIVGFVGFFALLNLISTFLAYAGIRKYVLREEPAE